MIERYFRGEMPHPRRRAALRAYTLRLLCLLACIWCASARAQASLKLVEGPVHHTTVPVDGNTVAVRFRVDGLNGGDVAGMNIVVDGIAYAATLEYDYHATTGVVNVPVVSNPQEFHAYALAGAYDNMDSYHVLDSRDAPAIPTVRRAWAARPSSSWPTSSLRA